MASRISWQSFCAAFDGSSAFMIARLTGTTNLISLEDDERAARTTVEASAPWAPTPGVNVPVTPSHLPWPEQSRGQSRVAQSAPENPFAQRHAPSTHVPWSPHGFDAHSSTSSPQSAPV